MGHGTGQPVATIPGAQGPETWLERLWMSVFRDPKGCCEAGANNLFLTSCSDKAGRTGRKEQQFPAALEDLQLILISGSSGLKYQSKKKEQMRQLSGAFYGMPLQPAPGSPG